MYAYIEDKLNTYIYSKCQNKNSINYFFSSVCRDKPEYSCEQNDFENIYSLKIAAPYQQHETYCRSYG